MEIQAIKQRFGIIGNSIVLDRAIDTARQVAPTDISVLINGESGVGKESFPKIIHNISARKHGPLIAVNCGAIPEGTIDSELFGHEKGSFTGAHETRKGYFETASGGTIFLDEVAELPLSTQVRLLRVLETGEFFKVGSSKVQKTDVRVVAATNVDIPEAILHGRFRQDLYYRLNTVPIYVPPLRERHDDVVLLFRKFAADFAEKYRMPTLVLTEGARRVIMAYRWPGNIRELKNITEQISIIEKSRDIDEVIMEKYLPEHQKRDLPVLYRKEGKENPDFTERELLYKVLFEMKRDIQDLKKLVGDIIEHGNIPDELQDQNINIIKKLYDEGDSYLPDQPDVKIQHHVDSFDEGSVMDSEVFEESLSLQDKEKDMINKALQKHGGKRKNAASELGISERTLYRKIKEYNL